MATTLEQAINMARSATRNADGNSYNNTYYEEAVRYVLGELMRLGRCKRGSIVVALTQDSHDWTLSDPTGIFHPSRLIRVHLSTDMEAQIEDESEVDRLIDAGMDVTLDDVSNPRVAMTSATTGRIWPAPDEAGVLMTLRFHEQLATLATVTSTLNVPDHLVRPAVWRGVPAALRWAEKEHLATDPDWRAFEAWCLGLAADDGLTGPSLTRDPRSLWR